METEFYARTGILSIGSRVRRLSERITLDARAIYELQGFTFEPRWFPVFYMLSQEKQLPVGELADRIGQSHASVSQIAKDLEKAGLIYKKKDQTDARRSQLELTMAAQQMAERMEDFYQDVYHAVAELLGEQDHQFWTALQELEQSLEQKSLLARVKDHRKARFAQQVKIIPYTPDYAQAFRDINVEWIQQYFKMEAADYKALDHPQEYILDRGGHIFIALLHDEPVGAVAMLKMENDTYELGKMGVRPAGQGRGIGYQLGQVVVSKARDLGAKRLYLESNTRLQPALRLYEKLGFKKLTDTLPSPYARSNVQMEMWL